MCGFCGCAIVLTGRFIRYSICVILELVGQADAHKPTMRGCGWQTRWQKWIRIVYVWRITVLFTNVGPMFIDMILEINRGGICEACGRDCLCICTIDLSTIYGIQQCGAASRCRYRDWEWKRQRQRTGLDKRLRFVLWWRRWCGNNDVKMTGRGVFEFDAVAE